MKKSLLFILFILISPLALAVPHEKPPIHKKVVKHQMTPAQIRAKRLAEWNRKHPPKRKAQRQHRAEPVNAKYLRIKRQIAMGKTHSKGANRALAIKPQPQKTKPVKNIKQRKTLIKTNKQQSKHEQQQIQLVYSALPQFCGGREVYHGKVNYHQQTKAFYYKHFYSKNRYDFDLFKLDRIDRRLLGKSIIFIGSRHSTYPPGGRQTSPFQSIISRIKVMQVVGNKINYASIKKQCAQLEK